MDGFNEFVVSDTSLFMCFRLAQERSHETKTTKIDGRWEWVVRLKLRE